MKTKNKVIFAVLGLLFFGWMINSAYIYFFVPGVLDDFAKCLSSKNAVVYGAIEWCEFTKMQAKMFGKSFKLLKYEDYSKYPQSFGAIKKTPTWIVDGKPYLGVQSIDRLSQSSGCTLPK